MLCDTDIFIWAQRGNRQAAKRLEREPVRSLSATENNLTLLSGNVKHFKPIRGLRLQVFTP